MPMFPAARLAVLLALCGPVAVALRAEVVMGTVAQCSPAADLEVRYRNLTPMTLDLKGYGMTIDGERVAGFFAQQSTGGSYVSPGATALVNFAGCGSHSGRPMHKQVSLKIGSCNEPGPMPMPAASTCSGLAPGAAYYDAEACSRDTVGAAFGDGFGGFLDSWGDRTQIQVSASVLFAWKGSQARFDPASMGGPFWMMSAAAVQEFLQVDMQAMLALGASRTGAGLADAQGTSLYASPANEGSDTEPYGSFGISRTTAAGRLFMDYPEYFPGKRSLADMVAPGGVGPTPANSPHHVNSGLLAALNLWWFYDGLSAAHDLCFKGFMRQAADRNAGLKLLLTGYLYGPNVVDQNTGADDYATHVLPASPAALNAGDITTHLKRNPWGAGTPDSANHNPIIRIISILDAITAANRAGAPCGGSQSVYDAGITLAQVRQIFFGAGGTAAAQGSGGLLLHFSLSQAARGELSEDLDCAFEKLKGKAPGRGPAEISFRYDFLSMLRVARAHFPGLLDKSGRKPAPLDVYSSEYRIWVYNHSQKPCAAAFVESVFPNLAMADTAFRPGQKVELAATDNRGIAGRAFTTDADWRAWSPATSDFTMPTGLAAGARLWYRVNDSCGNAVVEEAPLASGPVSLGSNRSPQRAGRLLGYGALETTRRAGSIAAYDVLGIFLGWARPLDDRGGRGNPEVPFKIP